MECLAFTHENKYIAYGSWLGAIKLFNVDSASEYCVLSGHTAKLNCIASIADSIFTVSGSSDRTSRIWNIAKKKLESILCDHSDTVSVVAVASGNRCFILSSLNDGSRFGIFIKQKENFICLVIESL